MSKLRSSLQPTSSVVSPMLMVLLVILMQVLLLGLYFYLADQDQLAIEPAELALLVAYSMIAIAIAVTTGVLRHRWMLRESTVRQRLLDVIDAIPDPSAVRDMNGKYIMWNKAAEAYHGIKAEHVLGKTPFELFPKEVARDILELDAQCAISNEPVVRRLVLPPLYGKGQRIATIRIAPVHSASDSSIRGVVTILHDVTQEEREASALRHISTQLKLALDTSGFGSWIWDLDSDVLTCSEQFQALLRYRGEHFRKDFVFRERLHPDDRERVVEAVRHAIKTQTPFQERYRMLSFDGEYLGFTGSGQNAQDAQGKHYFAGLLVPDSAAKSS